MGIHDRRYRDGGGGLGGSFRRAMRGGGGSGGWGGGGGFFTWSLPLFTLPAGVPGVGGIRVRVHIIYILMILSELLGSGRSDSAGLAYIAAAMATLLVLVLLHEFGHCLACRWVGGDADEVLMWPLGGLAFCSPPNNWKAWLITTIGGPGVNVLLIPVIGLSCIAAGLAPADLLLNPLRPWAGLDYFLTSYPRALLWSAYYTNLVLLGFNVLLPMFPMDGGRILQEILWGRVGYRRSMQIAVNVGFVAAVALGCLGIATGEGRLIGIAIFGGITCYNEKLRVAYVADEPAWAYDASSGRQGFDEQAGRSNAAQRRAYKQAVKRQRESEHRQRELRAMQARVDALLDKIRDHGMQSLTDKERAFLQKASEESRRVG